MTSETQGAEGAGTKAAEAEIRGALGRFLFKRFEKVDDFGAAHEALVRDLTAIIPATSAPAATPDVRSLLRTARSGLATYGAGAFEGTIAQIDAILAFDPAALAPAATPGVPDSYPDVLKFAGQLVAEIDGLIEATGGIAGLHRNGDLATWDELLPEGEYERLSSLDMLRDALTAANTAGAIYLTSPGVPDSLRALSEAATPGEWLLDVHVYHDEDGGPSEDHTEGVMVLDHDDQTDSIIQCSERDAAFIAALVNWFRAAHPAGQVGDAGAVKPHPFALTGRPSDDMLYATLEWLKQTKDGAENLGIQLKAAAAEHAVRSLLLAPAPDSTRTGAAETERQALEKLYDFACTHPNAVGEKAAEIDAAYRALAARPEAPSDAGWRDIPDDLKPGEYIVEDDRWGVTAARLYDSRRWFVACYNGQTIQTTPRRYQPMPPPSDPAPSGQAEG